MENSTPNLEKLLAESCSDESRAALVSKLITEMKIPAEYEKAGQMLQQKVAVVTDSTADFPPGMAEKLGIKVVPLYVRFGEEEYLDRINLSSDEFFVKLKKSKVLPMTSQPTPTDFLTAYKEIGKETEKIISLHASSKLSGTFNSAMIAKKEFPDSFDIRVIDSQTLSLSLGFLAMEAAEMARAGESIDDIEEEINNFIPKTRLYGVLDTLHYLAKGGRIGAASSLLGSILQVKPIIKIQNGEVIPVEKLRTKKRAIARLIEIVREVQQEGEIVRIGVLHAAAEGEAKELAAQLKEVYHNTEIPIVQTGTVIGTHSGPGLVGISYLLK
ncbi:MAG: DegV family protein [Candidatus Woesearchaeota archaeon]|nr:DegV family protein [Candidatus Woesearchaeota archaeon]